MEELQLNTPKGQKQDSPAIFHEEVSCPSIDEEELEDSSDEEKDKPYIYNLAGSKESLNFFAEPASHIVGRDTPVDGRSFEHEDAEAYFRSSSDPAEKIKVDPDWQARLISE